MANKMREFGITLTTVVKLSPRVIRQGMSKAFAESIVPLATPEQVAEHVAFNMIVNGIELTSIEGFGNLPASDAECERGTIDDAVELDPRPKKRERHAAK